MEKQNQRRKTRIYFKISKSLTIEKDEKGNYNLVNIKLRNTFIEQIYKLMQNGMFDMTISDEKDKDVRTTIMMDKQELQEYINRLNEYYEVSYYEVARLDEPKKGYQKKYLTIDETNDNGEKLFKLVELVTDDKKYPQKKANRIVGAIRVKEKEKVKVSQKLYIGGIEMENKELKENYIDERTGIEYRLVGDYYVPNLILKKEEKIILNIYGRARLKFLKENRKAEYTIMFINGTLNKHLKEIQETAVERIEVIIEQLKQKNNLTEEMKNTDQLYWVGMMNNFRNTAEEIVLNELIYV